MKIILTLLILTLFTSCSSSKEVILPFKNLGYSGERILPIKDNNSKSTFRVWFNNSTSIDRVITISRDSIFGFQGKLVEIGYMSKKKKKTLFYNEEEIEPKCGFEQFFKKLDSLKLGKLNTQNDFQFILHQPYSIYIVEYKENNTYNQFKFYTDFPSENNNKNNYSSIEELVFNEFLWGFYVKKK